MVVDLYFSYYGVITSSNFNYACKPEKRELDRVTLLFLSKTSSSHDFASRSCASWWLESYDANIYLIILLSD